MITCLIGQSCVLVGNGQGPTVILYSAHPLKQLCTSTGYEIVSENEPNQYVKITKLFTVSSIFALPHELKIH